MTNEDRNKVLDEAIKAVRFATAPSKWHHDQVVKAIEALKDKTGCDFCGEKEIWDERLNLCHACAKDHYS